MSFGFHVLVVVFYNESMRIKSMRTSPGKLSVLFCLAVLLVNSLDLNAAGRLKPARKKHRPSPEGSETLDPEKLAASIEKVLKTPDTMDNIQLAGILLNKARSSSNPGEIDLLCEGIYKVASASEKGYSQAIQAMEILAAGVTAKRMDAIKRACELQKKHYEKVKTPPSGSYLITLLIKASRYAAMAGDEASAKASLASAEAVAKGMHSRELEKTVKEESESLDQLLKDSRGIRADASTLKASPGNSELRTRLMMKYLLIFDSPSDAAGLLTYDTDETLMSLIPLAQRGPEGLPAEAAEEAYLWYQSLVEKAPKYSKHAIMFRERGFIDQFLRQYKEKDVRRLRASQELKKIDSMLKGSSTAVAIVKASLPWCFDASAAGVNGDDKVKEAIQKAQQYLMNAQKADGSWSVKGVDHYNSNSVTPMIVCALLESGISATNPRIQKALDFMSKTSPGKLDNLSLSWRCCAWARAQLELRGQYAKQLDADAKILHRAQSGGGFAFSADKGNSDCFYTFHATLGLGMASAQGVKISNFLWLKIIQWWRNEQKKFLSSKPESLHRDATGCTAGMLVALCMMGKNRKEAMDYPHLQDSLKWVNSNYANGGNDDALHYLFNLSRLGVAAGTSMFGNRNWFNWLSGDLTSRQGSDGSWKTGSTPPNIGTALALMTLSVTLK